MTPLSWNELTAIHPPPPLWLVVLSGFAALLLVAHGPTWRVLRGLITIAHEGGHALAAILTRRRLKGIRLHSDTSGLTLTKGRPTGPGMIVTAAAGYVSPSLIGLGAAWLVAAGHVTLLLWAVLALVAGMLLVIRNIFGAVVLLTVGGAVFALSWFAPPEVRAVCAYLGVWFLLLGAVRPIVELRSERRRGRAPNSDADQLARLTRVPGALWVMLFLFVSLAAVTAGGFILLVE